MDLVRAFELADLVDVAALLLCAGVERSMAAYVPKRRRYLSCIPAAVNVLFLRSGDGPLQLLMSLTGVVLFVRNFVTFMVVTQREIRAAETEIRASAQRIEVMKAEIERMTSGGLH